MITTGNRWCMLRTSGPRTLPLAKSLAAAGFEVWTPVKVQRSPARRHRPMIDVEVPILPTYLFARDRHVIDLIVASIDLVSVHPPFSVFRRLNRVPLIGEREIAGLRQANDAAAEWYAALRQADSREEARLARVAQMQSDRARRKALRAKTLSMDIGTWVEVTEMPALVGMRGQIVEDKGKSAVVCFGGSLQMQIEAWQLIPRDIWVHHAEAA